MSDKITCPYCDRSFDLDQLEMADLWRERTTLASRLGQAWKLANEYCDSFRTGRDARITLKRRVAILNDVARLWEGCVFEFDGRRYKTDQRQILDALHAVCSVAKTGFTNHNYLKRVLMGSKQGDLRQARLLSSEGLTAEEEAERERARRAGCRDEPFFAPAREPEPGNLEPEPTAEQLAENRIRLAEIAARIGGKL